MRSKLDRLEQWRQRFQIGLSIDELRAVSQAIVTIPNCRLLIFGIFGVGNDSVYWNNLNVGGKTAFIEGDLYWYRLVCRQYKVVDAILVAYPTRREKWKELLQTGSIPMLDLPPDVRMTPWDVILVDGPAGFHDSTPGRLLSIATCAQLATDDTDVFVHDIDRELELACCHHFFGRRHQFDDIGRLRCYWQKHKQDRAYALHDDVMISAFGQCVTISDLKH